MRRTEITLTKDRLTILREVEERMTKEQRYTILLTLIGCVAAVTFFYILITCAR